MKRMPKFLCSLGLTAAALLGTVCSGCAQTGDYTEEIREYQAKLESLAAENEGLRAQLEELTAGQEPLEESLQETQIISEESTAEEESGAGLDGQDAQPEETADDSSQAGEEDASAHSYQILVLGDSIWGNYRDNTGVTVKVDQYLGQLGYSAKIYNAAIGGTRATIDPEDSPYTFGPASENSLLKMISILDGKTDVGLLEGKPAYEDMQRALENKEEINVVIVAYGMNDFLSQVPINSSDMPWTGFGTALSLGVDSIKRIFPQAKVLIVAPSYASYFSVPVSNMGEKALYNYASVACDVARGEQTLCVDAYNNLGIDMYNSDQYLEDGVHLNEAGRDLYARAVVGALLYAQPGQISGNAMEID